MIYAMLPSDWRDLQNKVAEVFREIGFNTEVGKNIETVRSKVNIDVYAEDTSQTPKLIYLCECKYWNKRVPQEVVHSFRTVLSDFGAHHGLLISKTGFQRGSFKAAKHTNIQLLDWSQFQELFEDKWYDNWMSPRIYSECGALNAYTEPFNTTVSRAAGKFDEDKDKTFMALREEYGTLAFLALTCCTHVMPELARKPILPLSATNPRRKKTGQLFLPKDLVEATALREFLEILTRHCRKGTEAFDRLFGKRIG